MQNLFNMKMLETTTEFKAFNGIVLIFKVDFSKYIEAIGIIEKYAKKDSFLFHTQYKDIMKGYEVDAIQGEIYVFFEMQDNDSFDEELYNIYQKINEEIKNI